MRIEAAKFAEQIASDGDAGTRAVVGVAAELVLGVVRIVSPAVIPAGAVREHDAAGLLEATVGVDELRADQPNLALAGAPERLEQLREPALRHERVVVEKDEKLAARGLGPTVAGFDEPAVRRVSHDAHPRHNPLEVPSLVGRGVIDDDDLIRHVAGAFEYRRQACVRAGESVDCRNDDRGARLDGEREMQGAARRLVAACGIRHGGCRHRRRSRRRQRGERPSPQSGRKFRRDISEQRRGTPRGQRVARAARETAHLA